MTKGVEVLRRRGAEVRGFTLIEMLIVVSIIGLLAALLAPKLIGQFAQAKRTKAVAEIRVLMNALELYAVDNNKPPTTEQGLRALVEKAATDPKPLKWREGGYLRSTAIPKDPWGYDYIYVSPGLHDPDFDIISYGADGAEGGGGADADIESWNLQSATP